METAVSREIENQIKPPKKPRWRIPDSLKALRHRDFALYWSGLAVSATGSWMQSVAQGYLIYELTGSKVYLGFVTTMSSLPVLFLTLPAGVIADRFSKRKITICTQTAAMVLAFVLAALVHSGVVRPWHVVVLACILGVVNAIDIPARQAMTIELVGKEDIHNAVALTSSAFNAARLIGPSIAGQAIAYCGTAACFFINGVSYIAVIAGLLMVRCAYSVSGNAGGSMRKEIVDGLKYARSNVLIRDILLLTGIASVFALRYDSQMPALAKDVLGVGPKGLGLLVSAAGLGALVAALTVASIANRVRNGRIVTAGSIFAPLAIIGLSFAHSYYVSLACVALVGFGAMLFLAVSNSVLQIASPDEMRGRMLSVRTLVFMGLQSVGAIQVGFMAERFGVLGALRVGGSLCLLAALYFAVRSRSIREAQ